MKILITGGAGFVGSNIALTIQSQFPSAEISILDNLFSGDIKNIDKFKGEFIKGSVADKHLPKSLKGKGFDIIFHEAAITDTTIHDTEKTMGVNITGLKNMLALADAEHAMFVYASSAGVYGNGPVPMKEGQKLTPLNDYSASKAEGDKLAFEFCREKNMRAIGLRYFNVYGPGEKHKNKASSMILQLKKQIEEGKNPRIFKYGEQKRDFIYVKDIVEANIIAAGLRGKVGGISNSKSDFAAINIGTGTAETFNRIIEILNNSLGTKFTPEYFDNPYSFFQNHTQADTTLAKKILGFNARYNIEDGIKDYLNNLQ